VILLILGAYCAFRLYAFKALVLAALCWSLPLLGWAARNKAQFNRFDLDLHGGITILIGTMFFEINEMDTALSIQALKLSPIYAESQKLDEAQRHGFYFRKALEFMRENPRRVLRQWAHKSLNFWRFYPRMDKVYRDALGVQPNVGASRRMLVAISLLTEPALIVLGILGAWRLRRRMDTLFPCYWLVLGTFGIHMLVVSQMRYRLSVMPILILFACALTAGRKA